MPPNVETTRKHTDEQLAQVLEIILSVEPKKLAVWFDEFEI
jgi:hypothetical protein